MVLCSYGPTSCSSALFECCPFVDKPSHQPYMVLPSWSFQVLLVSFASGLGGVSSALRCQSLLVDSLCCVPLVLSTLPGDICNLRRTVLLPWFHFLRYCTQTGAVGNERFGGFAGCPDDSRRGIRSVWWHLASSLHVRLSDTSRPS